MRLHPASDPQDQNGDLGTGGIADFLPPAFGKRLSQLMARLREKHGITNAYERYARRAHPLLAADDDQMQLFNPPKSA